MQARHCLLYTSPVHVKLYNTCSTQSSLGVRFWNCGSRALTKDKDLNKWIAEKLKIVTCNVKYKYNTLSTNKNRLLILNTNLK